jgi:hypothetical protein
MSDPVERPPGDGRREAARAALDEFSRNSAALADIGADEAAAASLAYWEARKRSLGEAEAAELMERALRDSRAMMANAFDDEFKDDVRRGIVWDLAAGIVPAACLLLVLWAVAEFLDTALALRYVAACAATLLALAVFAGRVFTHPSSSPRWALRALGAFSSRDATALAGSVGALVVGAVVVVSGGAYLSRVSHDRQAARASEVLVQFRKVDTALALAVAAQAAHAEPRRVAALVKDQTGLDWRMAHAAQAGGDDVLAQVKLAGGGQAVVRSLPASATQPGVYQAELQLAGHPTAVRRYLYGTVEAPARNQADVRQVRLRLDKDSTLVAVLELPADTLPPAPGTAILAREKTDGVLETIQSVDWVRQSLVAGTSPSPGTAASQAASGVGM